MTLALEPRQANLRRPERRPIELAARFRETITEAPPLRPRYVCHNEPAMTIACAYLVSDGVVLGADSTATFSRSGGVAQLFNHVQKIFEVGRSGEGRMALCAYGAGQVGSKSHRTVAALLGDALRPHTSIENAAAHLRNIVEKEAASTPFQGRLGYFLGGSDPTRDPVCTELLFDAGKHVSTERLQVGEARFRGAPQLFMRAARGFDPALPQLLMDALAKRLPAMPPEELLAAFRPAFIEAISNIEQGGARDVPMREAVDFCHMYLHLTIKGFKFRYGPPVVGGPIELAFVSTDRHFRWVRHKPFDSAILEHDLGST